MLGSEFRSEKIITDGDDVISDTAGVVYVYAGAGHEMRAGDGDVQFSSDRTVLS